MNPLRLAFYYNHYNSLGHGLRSFNLLSYLKKNADVEILVLQGGKRQSLLPFDELGHRVILPYSFSKMGMIVDRYPKLHDKVLSTPWAQKVLARRQEVIISELEAFSPDVLITEYYPMGDAFWTNEVPAFLERIRPKVARVYCSCGYVSPVDEAVEVIDRFYDKIFIHSPKAFLDSYLRHFRFDQRDREKFMPVFDVHENKIVYTGFVIDKEKEPLEVPENYVLVSRGGGVINRRIISLALALAKHRQDINFVVILGPSTPEKEVVQVREVAGKNVRVYHKVSREQFNYLLEHCRVSLNMSGYNTSVKLLYYRKPAIIYPLDAVEQKARAQCLGEFLPVRVIDERVLSLRQVSAWLDELMEKECDSPFSEEDFRGERDFLNLIKDELSTILG